VLLVAWPRGRDRAAALAIGAGVGLVAVTAMWNPRWPLVSLAVVAFAILRLRSCGRRGLLFALLPPTILVLVALGVILGVASLDDYAFFTFTFNAGASRWFPSTASAAEWFSDKTTFYFCPPVFRGVLPAAAWLLVAAAVAIPRARAAFSSVDVRAVCFALALVPVALLEVRLQPAWPRLWPQCFLMWSFANAVVYACVPAALHALARGTARSVPLVDAVCAFVVLFLLRDAMLDRLRRGTVEDYWNGVSWIQHALRPSDRVMILAGAHPIAAPDASFYWFGFGDVVPYALQYAAEHPDDDHLPRMRDEDLPMCRAERRLAPEVRFLMNDAHLLDLPASRACFQRLLQAGRLGNTPAPGVYEVDPPR
jgi:hypothetical protein